MIFAKIDFINLLPFHVYIKKSIKSNQIKSIIQYKKSYPADINRKYKKRKVDAAFISSIASRREKRVNLGIIAKKDVQSVILIPGDPKEDFQSETSNALAKILKLEGEVLIGDKALKYFHENSNNDFIDLALAWKEKYNLPFVFATLCFCRNGKILKKVIKGFNKKHIKIPQYILESYAKRSGVSKKHILEYLEKIDYEINTQEKKALKKFLTLAKKEGL